MLRCTITDAPGREILDRHATIGWPRTLLFVSMLLAGCSTMRPPAPDRTPPGSAAMVYVARRGWHIDVGFALSDLEPPLAALGADFPGARYLSFGFGDRRYLMSRNHGGPQLLAALWPGAGLLLVTALKGTPEAAFGADQVVALRMDREQMRAVEAFVWQSLSVRPHGAGPLAAGPYEGSLFYEAAPRYSALHTCNTWAAETLRASGLPIHPAGVVFAAQLWGQIGRLIRAQPQVDSAPVPAR
jgi:uncharacterized protein (TIGR02117 family)